MKEGQPSVIYLKDYQVPDFLIDKTVLRFEIHDDQTRVISQLSMRRNPEAASTTADLVLNGGPGLTTQAISIDDRTLLNNEYQITDETLTLGGLPETFELKTEVCIRPQDNLALSGLYQSGGMFCTQCEAEGFRNITWYLDRPDVMSVFETTIEASLSQFPVLLSNGNAIYREIQGDRQQVTWQDPFKKPAYLFALVAGDLEHVESDFITQSGRTVTLQIFTERHNIDKVDFAMESLKASMTWDEGAYGREYDLDIFMIVAVESFNMGAMENKGLNIFNTSCVLAHPDTTTDAGFQRVEAVVAHEYFHNWSGNRVTCRDWFQLSLKEGFTVLRDQQFSADRWSRGVCRVGQVSTLRSAQFPEDAGPMAHPIRPPSFIEINNFYTATVYEKGAEVVRMLHTLLGESDFRLGTDCYFDRHDGQAVTTEDFVKALEAASGRDLMQFRRWYDQAGTPVVTAYGEYLADQEIYRLTLSQQTPATPGQSDKAPLHMPITLGLIGPDGQDLDFQGAEVSLDGQSRSQVLSLTEAQQVFEIKGVAQAPLPSIARGFSAPIKLLMDYSAEELAFLCCHDSDPFNRWEAGQRLAVLTIESVQSQLAQGETPVVMPLLIEVLRHHLDSALEQAGDPAFDSEMVSLLLSLPSIQYLIELQTEVDVLQLLAARDQVRLHLAKALSGSFLAIYKAYHALTPFELNAQAVGARSLKNLALTYLLAPGDSAHLDLALAQFNRQDNMTDVAAALRAIENCQHPDAQGLRETVMPQFFERWSAEALVIDAWFSIQASSSRPYAIARVEALMQHPAFSLTTPNRMRSVLGGFAMNIGAFHESGGAGYRLLAETVIALNGFNPQMAARMLGPLTGWRKFDPKYGAAMQAALQMILDSGELSPDVFEVVTKTLA